MLMVDMLVCFMLFTFVTFTSHVPCLRRVIFYTSYISRHLAYSYVYWNAKLDAGDVLLTTRNVRDSSGIEVIPSLDRAAKNWI